MLSGLHAAASGMHVSQQRLDALANDISNVNTAGYRRQRLAFHDLLYVRGRAGSGPEVPLGAGAGVRSAGTSAIGGSAQATGRSLDLKIEGEGFFRVTRPDGTEGLTRKGSWQLDTQGRLTLPSGDVLASPVRIPANTPSTDVTVGSDGRVSIAGRPAGRIEVVAVRSPEGLVPLGDDVLAATPASGAGQPIPGRIMSGYLETSGVDLAEVMSEMIEAQRAYQLAGKAVSTQDELLRIANGVKR